MAQQPRLPLPLCPWFPYPRRLLPRSRYPLTPTPSAAPAVPQMVTVIVPDAVPFRITLAADIPADADVARPIRFTTTEDFKVKDVVVIAKGAAVYGEISETAKKRVFGIGGSKLSFKLTKAEAVGGHTINVRALAARRGDGATQRQVDAGQKTPKDVAAAQGAQYIAYVDGEQPVTVPQK